MNGATLIRRARRKAGLSQRELAERAGTSHATLAAYETGAKVPRVDTLDRILRAAGYEPEVVLSGRADAGREAREAKGRELREALELAAHFPVRRLAKHLPVPVIGRRCLIAGPTRGRLAMVYAYSGLAAGDFGAARCGHDGGWRRLSLLRGD